MFGSEARGSSASGRYPVEIVSGEVREKSHKRKVQEAIDEGSATTTNSHRRPGHGRLLGHRAIGVV